MPELGDQLRTLIEEGIRPIEYEDIEKSETKSGSLAGRSMWLALPAVLLIGVIAVIAVEVTAPGTPKPKGSAIVHASNSPVTRQADSTAALVVLRQAASAASSADSQVPGPNQVIVLNEAFLVSGYVLGAGDKLFHYQVPGHGEWRIRADGSGSERITLGDPRFPTSSDEVIWQTLGSINLVPSHEIDESFPLTPAVAQAQAQQGGLGAPPSGPIVVPYNQVASLSTNPVTLRQQLVDEYESGHFDVGQTFDLAATLLEEGAGPSQRAALYQMIASLPGVVLDGQASTDLLGAEGTAVSVDVAGTRHQLIFDPLKSSVLEERVSPEGAWPASVQPLGNSSSEGDQMLTYTVFEGTSIANS